MFLMIRRSPTRPLVFDGWFVAVDDTKEKRASGRGIGGDRSRGWLGPTGDVGFLGRARGRRFAAKECSVRLAERGRCSSYKTSWGLTLYWL